MVDAVIDFAGRTPKANESGHAELARAYLTSSEATAMLGEMHAAVPVMTEAAYGVAQGLDAAGDKVDFLNGAKLPMIVDALSKVEQVSELPLAFEDIHSITVDFAEAIEAEDGAADLRLRFVFNNSAKLIGVDPSLSGAHEDPGAQISLDEPVLASLKQALETSGLRARLESAKTRHFSLESRF